MANSVFTAVGFSTTENTHTFSTTNSSEYLLIDADTATYNEIYLKYKIKYNT